MLSAKEPGINGPCPWSDHCGSGTQGCQDNRNPRVAGVGRGNPKLSHGYERSYDWSPETNKKKYSGEAGNDLWNHRWGIGRRCEPDDSKAHEQDSG